MKIMVVVMKKMIVVMINVNVDDNIVNDDGDVNVIDVDDDDAV